MCLKKGYLSLRHASPIPKLSARPCDKHPSKQGLPKRICSGHSKQAILLPVDDCFMLQNEF